MKYLILIEPIKSWFSPLCSGTYYDPKEIKITIDLVNKEQSH